MGELKNKLEFTEAGGIYAQDIDMPDGSSIICVESKARREIVGPNTEIFSGDSLICLCKKGVDSHAKVAIQRLYKAKTKRKA